MQRFISRNEDGVLVQHTLEWDVFVDDLLSMAKNQGELSFIGQLVEDLQYQYNEKEDEFVIGENNGHYLMHEGNFHIRDITQE